MEEIVWGLSTSEDFLALGKRAGVGRKGHLPHGADMCALQPRGTLGLLRRTWSLTEGPSGKAFVSWSFWKEERLRDTEESRRASWQESGVGGIGGGAPHEGQVAAETSLGRPWALAEELHARGGPWAATGPEAAHQVVLGGAPPWHMPLPLHRQIRVSPSAPSSLAGAPV